MALLEVDHLTFTYPGAAQAALNEVSLAVDAGEFVMVCGVSGCGKTTLLRHLKTCLEPVGARTGEVLLEGRPLALVPLRDQASAIGYVGQDIDAQMVCPTVAAELAFGLESLGVEPSEIRSRVAEMASYLGLGSLYRCSVHELSGGQKQLVNLAAVMVMRPKVLVLDEPCAHLDPLAARTLIDAVVRLNRERGAAVVMVDHRLQEAFCYAHRVVVMEEGRVSFVGKPQQAARALTAAKSPFAPALPTSARIAAALDGSGADLPLEMRAGRRWLQQWCAVHPPNNCRVEDQPFFDDASAACEMRSCSFRYARNEADVLRSLCLRVPSSGVHGLVGGNGSGKSTLLKVMAGVLRPYRGRVLYEGRSVTHRRPSVALLPQEPLDLFAHDTVQACLDEAAALQGAAGAARMDSLVRRLGIAGLLDAHPHDLSAGELQRAALALVLVRKPRLLLLDEATRNLDPPGKQALADLLADLAREGVAVLLSTHDLDFCAEHTQTVALLFDGGVAAQGPTRQFFATHGFYTTAAAIMSRPMLADAVTVDEVIARCRP